MRQIDLHVHSTCSDGTLSPTELVVHAAHLGLSAFALTDHDCTDGIDEAFHAAGQVSKRLPQPLEIIPGIEFSTEYLGADIHIVGLDMNYRNPQFQTHIAALRENRLLRNQKMIDRMASDGIAISLAQMKQEFGDGVWTRAHFGRFLVEHGYARSKAEAFSVYIGEGCKYYIPREKISPFDVTNLIWQFGGIPVLAHPLQYHYDDEKLRTLLRKLTDAGLIGIEVYYSTHSREDEAYLLSIASDFGLLPGGGSDYHGENKPEIELGSGIHNLAISYSILNDLRARRQQNSLQQDRAKYMGG